MFLLDGKVLPTGVAFEHDGVQYPANWLNLASQAEKTAIGITEVPDQVRPDDRFYWVTENADGSYTATPKDLDNLKKQFIDQVNDSVWKLLLPSDFVDSRAIHDPEFVAPQRWIDWRASVRTTATASKAAINAAATVEDLIPLVVVNFPRDPSQPADVMPMSSNDAPAE